MWPLYQIRPAGYDGLYNVYRSRNIYEQMNYDRWNVNLDKVCNSYYDAVAYVEQSEADDWQRMQDR